MACWLFQRPTCFICFRGRDGIYKTHRNKFDVIIMDINGPVRGGPAALIYTREFFESLKNLLTGNGIFVTQGIRSLMMCPIWILYSIKH